MTSSLLQYERPITAAIVAMLSFAFGALASANAVLPSHQHAALPVNEALTLTKAIDEAFALYPTIIELAARTAEADAWSDRGQSWLSDRPSAILRYQTDNWGANNGLDEYEAGILLPLWSWGGRRAVQKLGDTLSIESDAAGLALRWEVAGLLRVALWGIALAENDHDLAEQALDTAARLTAAVERRHELGDVALGDVLLAQSAYLEAQTSVIEATASLLDAERAYRSVTGLERRPPFTAEVLSEIHDIQQDHPALAFADAEVRRANAALALAEKTVRTGTSLLIGPRSERSAFGDEFDDSFGITLSVPFGGTSHRRTEISAAARIAASAKARRDQQLRTLTMAAHEAAHGLTVVDQNLAAASNRLDIAERHQAMGESAYEKGELELIDLLKVQATAIAAKRQVTRLRIDEKRQTALYNQAVGKLP